MDVYYGSRKLQASAQSLLEATRQFGDLGRRYIERLHVIHATPTFSELRKIQSLRIHPLKGVRVGEWALKLNQNWRLVFTVPSETECVIESVEDYHDH